MLFRLGYHLEKKHLPRADLDGNVANYVETEQLVQFNKSVASFVLTRGSIPFQWTQRPNIKYKPKPKLNNQNDQLLIYKRHIDEQVVLYGRQVLVNLIDQKGGEKLLESQFSDIYHRADNKKVRYVHFDFHKECSKMRWHRLSILMDKLKQDIEDHGYYFSTNESTLQRQTGVFRVNCIDCLDRTNVVQSMLAKVILEEQLLKLGVFKQGNLLSSFPEFESTYRNVWADNADACSTQYSGTGALKTDYTRDSAQLKVRIIPILALVSLSMAIIGLLLPPSESLLEQMLFICFWILTGVGSCFYVLRHGPYYVNQPLLVHKLQKDI
ncbi:Oidioi.mRNA.OKI2018_I69.XSR.g14676.t1.cds [Oikopleura dioica]|uniref:Phosphatidylinositol-3-phosphatase SAC1 n=1 Tax=Oikopleura dioica TaxID=34765 RepID=A0ABN7SFJ4_OIKDI|nr:Oidioi.mRNA.OKI2018_I69.XSR.g14676.t1.cds [Oikopleura dioica]